MTFQQLYLEEKMVFKSIEGELIGIQNRDEVDYQP